MTQLQFLSACQVIGVSLCLLLMHLPNVSAEVSIIQSSMLDVSQEKETTHDSSLSNCIKGNGNAVTQTRPLADFSDIKIDGVFTVIIELQQEKTLTVMGDENLLPHFLTKVEDHILHVSEQGSICPQIFPEIRVTSDSLAKLSADGAVDIHISHLNNKTFVAHLDGASHLNLFGTSKKFTSILAGSNTLLAGEFESQEATITIDGAGEAVLNVSRKLIAEINGVGDIVYTGNPSIVERHINGAGDVESQ